MPLTIRDATPADAPTIADYNNRIAAETEDKQLDPNLIGPGVEALLADPSKGQYWVAEFDGEIVGQIMTTYEWSDWRNGMIWWIQSVYVHADHRRSGVFRALHDHVEALARARPDVIGLRLCVEKDNTRAQATYDSLGYSTTEYRVMQVFWHDPETSNGDSEC